MFRSSKKNIVLADNRALFAPCAVVSALTVQS
jgi:hypothetical protein